MDVNVQRSQNAWYYFYVQVMDRVKNTKEIAYW
jgi:hypothetical protein